MTAAILNPDDDGSMHNGINLAKHKKVANVASSKHLKGQIRLEETYIIAHGSEEGVPQFIEEVLKNMPDGDYKKLYLVICGATDPEYNGNTNGKSLKDQTIIYLEEEKKKRSITIQDIVAYKKFVLVEPTTGEVVEQEFQV